LSAPKQTNFQTPKYRELKHFGNLFQQALRDAEEVLPGVLVNRNSELEEPPTRVSLCFDFSFFFSDG
jgi:hypothetical protein